MKAFIFALLILCVLCDTLPESSPRPPKETEKGKKVVYYNQADSRWGKKKWTIINDPKQTYQSSACGPTSMAMAVATLADPTVTPVTMGDLALEKKCRTKNSGTKWEFFCQAAEKYGLDCEQTGKISDGLKKIAADENGINVLAVAIMKAGYWTKSGHYILVYDIDKQGNPWVHDPGHRNKYTQSKGQFIKECRQLFIISKRNSQKSDADATEPAKSVADDNANASLNKIEEVAKAEPDQEEKEQPKGKKVNDIADKFKTIPGAKFQQGGKKYEKYSGHPSPKWVVVHYTGVANAGAYQSTLSLSRRKDAVSTHFFCDEKDVYRAVDEEHPAWHVGAGQPKDSYKKERLALAKENHEKWKKAKDDFKGDLYSFGVDLCTVKASKSRKLADEDWDFKPETIVNGAKTVAYLCKKYNIPINHVIRHADAVGKACPRPFVSLSTDKDPHKNDKRWEDFKALVEEYL